MGGGDFLSVNDIRAGRAVPVQALGGDGGPEIAVLRQAEVIVDGVATDIIEPLFPRYPARCPANHEPQAGAGVDAVHPVRARYLVQVPRQGISGLDEKHGLARRFLVRRVAESIRQLLVMSGVIQRDTDHRLIGNGLQPGTGQSQGIAVQVDESRFIDRGLTQCSIRVNPDFFHP